MSTFLAFLVPNPGYFAAVRESVAACRMISFVVLSSSALRAIGVFCTAMGTAINGCESVSFVGVLCCPISAVEKSHLIYSHQMLVGVLFPCCSF